LCIRFICRSFIEFATDFTLLQVGSCGVDFPIRLEPLQEEMKHLGSEYDLEVFPGLILKMQNPQVTLLIFVSGKIVLTGASNWEHMVDAFEKIYPTLLKYRKD
jgi:transcription initiation factor TFIID TATA-box-binding protein